MSSHACVSEELPAAEILTIPTVRPISRKISQRRQDIKIAKTTYAVGRHVCLAR